MNRRPGAVAGCPPLDGPSSSRARALAPPGGRAVDVEAGQGGAHADLLPGFGAGKMNRHSGNLKGCSSRRVLRIPGAVGSLSRPRPAFNEKTGTGLVGPLSFAVAGGRRSP